MRNIVLVWICLAAFLLILLAFLIRDGSVESSTCRLAGGVCRTTCNDFMIDDRVTVQSEKLCEEPDQICCVAYYDPSEETE